MVNTNKRENMDKEELQETDLQKNTILEVDKIIQKKLGSVIEGKLFVGGIENKITKTNKPYTDLMLTDGSRQIEAKIWDESLVMVQGYNALKFTARLGEFNGKNQLTLSKYKPIFIELDEAKSPVNVEDGIKHLKYLVSLVKDKEFNLLLNRLILDDIDNPDNLFRTAPAATHMHHNYRNGLLRHTLEVARIAYNISRAYSGYINTDLVITGALLHDIGKIKVYLIDDFEISRDEYEGLQEHLYIGTQMVMEHKDIFKNHEHKMNLLINIIGSHHGTLEWGALFLPATQEAIIVHLADMASAQLEAIETTALETQEDVLKMSYSGMFKHKLSPAKVKEIMNGEITIGTSDKLEWE